MKHDCDIVRDLMPMCIDGTASEKTRIMVDEHVQECPPCDAVYREMMGEAKMDMPVQPQTAEFTQTVRRMNKTRRQRKLMMVLAGVLATVALFAVAYGVYWQFFELVPVRVANRAALHTREDGYTYMRLDGVPENVQMYLLISETYWYATESWIDVASVRLYSTRHQRANRNAVYDLQIGQATADGVTIDLRFGSVEVKQIAIAENIGLVYLKSLQEPLKDMAEVQIKKPTRIDANELAASRMVITDGDSDWYGYNPNMMPFVTAIPSPTPEPES